MPEETLAANADVVNVATSEVPASTTETPAEPAAQVAQPDITQTQEFARRAAEMRDKAIADFAKAAGIEDVKTFDDVKKFKQSKANAPIDLTPEEKTLADQVFQNSYKELLEEGNSESAAKRLAKLDADAKRNEIISAKRSQAEQTQQKQQGQLDAIIRENPEYLKDGKIAMPDEVKEAISDIMASGLADNIYSAHKIYMSDKAVKDSKKEIDELKATVEALKGNSANSAATTGGLATGPAVDQEFYTSEEYDRLPQEMKNKLIRSGKIDAIMAKWK